MIVDSTLDFLVRTDEIDFPKLIQFLVHHNTHN